MNKSHNFNDPRVRTRCIKAIEWTEQYVSALSPNWLSTREIDRHLGSQRNNLSKWLRTQLLVCINPIYSKEFKKCKTYIRNKDGIKDLKINLGLSQQAELGKLTEQYQEELTTGLFVYKDCADRQYHRLQFIPSDQRAPLLAKFGYSYNYDIKCAAPTLISQYAGKLGLIDPTPTIDAYLTDRTAIRQLIAKETGITEDQVKFVINAVLHGARLSHYLGGSIIEYFKRNHMIIDRLKANKCLNDLINEFKLCWQVIEYSKPLEYIQLSNGRMRKKLFGSRSKAEIYRQLEKEVMGEISSYLKKKKIVMFKEHDGFRTREIFDVRDLERYVRTNTGYVIDIDYITSL
jgi:hypothetical protein